MNNPNDHGQLQAVWSSQIAAQQQQGYAHSSYDLNACLGLLRTRAQLLRAQIEEVEGKRHELAQIERLLSSWGGKP